MRERGGGVGMGWVIGEVGGGGGELENRNRQLTADLLRIRSISLDLQPLALDLDGCAYVAFLLGLDASIRVCETGGDEILYCFLGGIGARGFLAGKGQGFGAEGGLVSGDRHRAGEHEADSVFDVVGPALVQGVARDIVIF